MSSLGSSDIQLLSTTHAGQNAIARLGRVAVERRRYVLSRVFGLFVAFLLMSTGSQWPMHGICREVLFVMGMCLAAVGTLGRTWSNLFISGYKSKVLIKTGPYSMCRNPLYFFSAIGMIGIGLCSGTLVIPVIMVIFFAAYYPLIISCEEYRLSSTHRDDFHEYCRTTPTFWPRIRNYQEPETYVMFPGVMRKNIVDAFWFVALAAFVRVISDLHEINLLPSVCDLW